MQEDSESEASIWGMDKSFPRSQLVSAVNEVDAKYSGEPNTIDGKIFLVETFLSLFKQMNIHFYTLDYQVP